MSELKEQIEEARDRVAQFRLRAEKPSARLEDDYALEKARTRLLTLELRSLRSELASGGTRKKSPEGHHAAAERIGKERARADLGKVMRTKHKHLSMSARERAEASFAALRKTTPADTEGR